MPDPLSFNRPDGSVLAAVPATAGGQPADWAAALALGPLGALVVLAGGDEPVEAQRLPQLTQLLSRGLVRTLRDVAALRGGGARALCVVRAGGQGCAALLGRIVAEGADGLALLGVAPQALLASGEASPLPGLSHLLATPGTAWGDELRARTDLVQALADARPATGAGAMPLRPILLVIGGGPAVLAEVARAVGCGWSVLLVEGSGGSADALARQFRAGEADPGDSTVVDILTDGRISCITLGDKPAPAVAALATTLQRECGGTSVLRLAWETFGALDRSAMAQQREFVNLQGWILALGVVVVAMSVAHALAPSYGWGWVEDGLRYGLIVAPISVSALIAVGNRFSPGKRWVLLRAAAEALKREIYRYRVRPRQALADGTHEKRLQKAMEDITRRLARTEVNGMANPPYTGPIPPPDAVAKGDDGLSLLGTERYVRLRLSDQLAYYGNKTTALERRASGWQALAIVVGALGTLLAALGGDWVSWVALTSAVASAAMAYLGYMQFETTLTSYNQTAADLKNLLGWWTALLPDEQADPATVDKLVTTTEKVLADEQDGWAQNMTNALLALRTQQDDATKAPAAKGGGGGGGDGGDGGDGGGAPAPAPAPAQAGSESGDPAAPAPDDAAGARAALAEDEGADGTGVVSPAPPADPGAAPAPGPGPGR